MTLVKPPRLAVRFLSRLIRPDIVREDILGDLTETFGRRARFSRFRASLWFWWQVLSVVAHRASARWTVRRATRRHKPYVTPSRPGGDMIYGLVNDLRYAVRGLVRSPAFAAAAILTVALGVGANAAIFSVVNGVLLRPLPWPESDRLVSLWPEKRWSGEMLQQVRERTTSFEVLAMVNGEGYTLLGDGDAERVFGARVSDTYFDVLRVSPQLGRLFNASDRYLEGGGVAVITHGLWRRRYAADPDIIGKTARIAGVGRETRTVIGVLPEGFAGLFGRAEVWTPVDMSADSLEYAGQYGSSVIGRLAAGRTAEAATAEMKSLIPEFSDEHPTQFREIRHSPIDVVPLLDNMIGDSRTTLWLLFGGVGIVLLIACANVANLLLARGIHRRREHEIRLALGAGPWRIVRQTMVESGVLGMVGGAAGVLIALAATPLLSSPVAAMMPRDATSVLNLNVLLFSAGASIVAGLLFGIVAARSPGRTGGPILHGSARGSTAARGRHRLNNALVIGEIALAMAVVVGGSLLVKSFRTLMAQDPGFAADRLLTVQIAPPEGRYSEESAREQYFTSILQRVGGMPGITSASLIRYLPLTGNWAGTSYRIEGREPPPGSTAEVVSFNVTTPEYFSTLGVRLLEGRWLTNTDRDGAIYAGLINQAFRDRHWPGESVVGKRVLRSNGDPFFEVVGVVANIRQRDLSEEPAPEVYFTPSQTSWDLRYLVVQGDVANVRAGVVDAVRAIDRDVPILSVRTMEEVIAEETGGARSLVVLFSSFAVLALTLGMLGIYGLMSYTVSQRIREIGVRLALGATARNVLVQTLARAIVLVGIGAAIGIGLSLAGTRLLTGILFGVRPTDPFVMGGTVLLIAAAGAVAALLPALRAARASPLNALRLDA